jgi:hypothetical protein
MIEKGKYGEEGLSRRAKDVCALQRLGATYMRDNAAGTNSVYLCIYVTLYTYSTALNISYHRELLAVISGHGFIITVPVSGCRRFIS